MRVDVAFTPAGLAGAEVAGRTVFVVDVLRASTTIAVALANGARGVIPVASIEEAMKLSQTLERREVLLAGERNATRIAGFDLGNSPLEMTEGTVRGIGIVKPEAPLTARTDHQQIAVLLQGLTGGA
jgi:2-phosphosulfolactate phosphatase